MARQVRLNDGKFVMASAEIRNRCFGPREGCPEMGKITGQN